MSSRFSICKNLLYVPIRNSVYPQDKMVDSKDDGWTVHGRPLMVHNVSPMAIPRAIVFVKAILRYRATESSLKAHLNALSVMNWFISPTALSAYMESFPPIVSSDHCHHIFIPQVEPSPPVPCASLPLPHVRLRHHSLCRCRSIRAPSPVHTRRRSGRMSADSMDWGSLDPHELFFDPSSGRVDMPMHYIPFVHEGKRSVEIQILESGVSTSYDPYCFDHFQPSQPPNPTPPPSIDLESQALPQRLCVWSRDVWFRIVGWLRG
ncbi:hypothetical protein JB92DRAFT_3125575 [Gautieria morchelliformis]|nr:hypothetical protein JB92DRAFT_3125575 [Gautieria morchelliformis]